jgi:hypothetical protein
LAQHGAVRNLWDAVRNLWDYRGLTPPSKVLVKIGIERYGRKASGTGRALPFHQRRRLHAERLAHHLHRDPLGAVRILWDYRGLKPFSKLLVKIGIERHGRKVSGSGGGSPFHRGRRQDRRALCSQSLVAGRFRRIAGELPRVSVLYQHDKERSVSSSCCC